MEASLEDLDNSELSIINVKQVNEIKSRNQKITSNLRV